MLFTGCVNYSVLLSLQLTVCFTGSVMFSSHYHSLGNSFFLEAMENCEFENQGQSYRILSACMCLAHMHLLVGLPGVQLSVVLCS